MMKSRKGFSVIELLIVLVVVGVIAAGGFFVSHRSKSTPKSTTPVAQASAAGEISWTRSESGWKASGTPSACPSTITSPTDTSKATAILYPGQYRGGNYKPHGGFRFTNGTNDSITVKLPTDAYLYKGSRYIEQGETQYLLVFINPCGYMYKFDHLYTLSSALQKIVDDNFPAAKENDSSTTNLSTRTDFKAGDVVATAIGFKKTGNSTFDFGVYDLNQKNTISSNAQWAAMHKDDNEYGPYALCWLDILSGGDSAKVKALPAGDGVSGSISDYCKTSAGNTLTNTVGNPVSN